MDKYVRKLQISELEILEEVDKICKNNNIDYFLAGGTLLGAIRHKGFIPWDDDIDIMMTRKNYKKFTKVCLKNLGENYYIDNYRTNKKCVISYTKIKKKNTLFVEKKNFDNFDENSGIWIDVFPLDGVKVKLSRFHKIQKKIFDYIYTLITIKNGSNYYKNSKIKKNIYKFFLKFIPYIFLRFLLEFVVSFYDEDKVDYLCSFSTVYDIEKDTFLKKKLFPYNKVIFEKKYYNGMDGYDYYLRQMYGEYMKLPPKEKRVNHKPYIIKFEDGETIKFELDNK